MLQREGNLELSALDGHLTATLQVPGLRIGDELEFAATVRGRDPTLGDRSFGAFQMPPVGLPGAYRTRLLWPESKPIKWRATPDLPALTPKVDKGLKELVYELRDPESVIVADGAPARVNLRRFVEYSEFSSWGDVSHRIWPLFDRASALAADSPVRAEAARIAAATADPAERVEAALRLVQDRIRYVYVGLDGGNYLSASADETWQRRFGDCKGKTALLLALLRELGVPGEPVLVNTAGGDGTDERLPNPALFNHVLVRVVLDGQAYWLDGTRLGDQYLEVLPAPDFRWALPLRAGAVDLEKVPASAPDLPQLISVLEIDGSAGIDRPAKVKARHVLRGTDVQQMRTALAGMPAADADRAVRAYWRERASWVEPEEVSWRFEEKQGAIVLAMTGEGKLDWEGDEEDGRWLDIPGAGFSPPAEFRRPKEQDQAAPWLTDFPAYRCWATTIKLPPATGRWGWDYAAAPVDEYLGGTAYWRVAGLRDNVMRTIMSRRVDTPEISSAEARDVNRRLPDFDNNISRIFQREGLRGRIRPSLPDAASTLPEGEIDWAGASVPCAAPVTVRVVTTEEAG